MRRVLEQAKVIERLQSKLEIAKKALEEIINEVGTSTRTNKIAAAALAEVTAEKVDA